MGATSARFAIRDWLVMKRSSWEIELQCSQCGAPVSLEETDHLLICSYCHVRLYLWSPGQFCYCLPALKASSEKLIFIPYWRFKGVAYSVIPFDVRHRILDATLLAYSHPVLPVTLGIRPQALKMRFASGEIQGTFIKPRMPLREAVMRIQNQFGDLEGVLPNRPPFHREFIGELGSLIFFPAFVRHRDIVDGILGKVIGPQKDLGLDEASSGMPEHWQIRPISTLCPNCGNPLQGGRESLLLFCTICHMGWNPSSGRLVASPFEVVPGKGDSSVYLPFWRIRVAVKGMTLKSYADLARAANLPKMVHSEWEKQEVAFWVPAFRVHPSLFLRLSKQMTFLQPVEKTEPVLPKATLHPITFSEESAAASLKVHLAYLLTKKRVTFPKLHEITIDPVESTLVFIPFISTGRELVHPRLGIGLQQKMGSALQSCIY
jgi:DNA-directed RNA polymerase subunit RPC12/RpoP